MREDEEVERMLRLAGKLLDPRTAEGMSFWKRPDQYHFWSTFDAKSYALFFLLSEAYENINYDDIISKSLTERASGDLKVRENYLREIIAAEAEIKRDLQKIISSHGSYQIKVHTFESRHFQVRFVAPS
jgi:hypothetical protein